MSGRWATVRLFRTQGQVSTHQMCLQPLLSGRGMSGAKKPIFKLAGKHGSQGIAGRGQATQDRGRARVCLRQSRRSRPGPRRSDRRRMAPSAGGAAVGIMSEKFPFLPLSVDAYFNDTRHLTTEQHGAYLLLLMEAWKSPSVSLPDDDNILARLSGMTIAKWRKHKPTIMEFWSFDGRSRRWTQKRLRKERDYVAKKRAQTRDAAVKRWNKRKKSDATGHATAYAPPPPPPQEDSPSQDKVTSRGRDTREATSDDQWNPHVVDGGRDA